MSEDQQWPLSLPHEVYRVRVELRNGNRMYVKTTTTPETIARDLQDFSDYLIIGNDPDSPRNFHAFPKDDIALIVVKSTL